VLKARAYARDLQNFLFFLEINAHVGGDGVGKTARLINTSKRGEYFGWHFFAEVNVFFELGHGGTQQRLHLVVGDIFALDFTYPCRSEIALIIHMINHGPVAAFNQYLNRAIRKLKQLKDIRDGSNLVNVVGAGVILGSTALSNQQYLLVSGHCIFECFDRLLSADKQWQNHVRIHHHIAQRQKG